MESAAVAANAASATRIESALICMAEILETITTAGKLHAKPTPAQTVEPPALPLAAPLRRGNGAPFNLQ